ncbi:MAG: OmpA family protein [Solirubrobacteraceae bacterium]
MRSRSSRRRQVIHAAIAATACTVALSACGGGSSKHSSSTRPATSPTKSSTTATQAPTHPLAVYTYNASSGSGPQPMRVSIYDLRRDGPFLVLDFGISCPDQASSGCDTSDTLKPLNPNSSGQLINSIKTDTDTAAGVTLIDPGNLLQYLPVRDSEGRPFTSKLPLISDTRNYLAWVRYPAPPASVTSMDITFPNGGPQVSGVPISDGSGPTAETGVASSPAPFVQTAATTTTTGLHLPVQALVATSGNPAGSDAESAHQDTITLSSDVLFRFAKSSLTAKARSILAGAAAQIKSRAVGSVAVTGYTDSIGSNAVNVPLSIARAKSVVKALAPNTPSVKYVASGKGSADPVAPNTQPDGADNPAGRALNRRVTIVFAVKKLAPPKPPAPAAPSTASAASSQTATFKAGPPMNKDHYSLSVDSLFREGNLMVARLSIGCLTSGGCTSESDMLGTNTVPPELAPFQYVLNGAFGISGFYVVAPQSGTEYLVLHNIGGAPLTGSVNANIGHGQVYKYWAYFPAPPAGVDAVTLVTPQGGTRIRVPVSPSPPPA